MPSSLMMKVATEGTHVFASCHMLFFSPIHRKFSTSLCSVSAISVNWKLVLFDEFLVLTSRR